MLTAPVDVTPDVASAASIVLQMFPASAAAPAPPARADDAPSGGDVAGRTERRQQKRSGTAALERASSSGDDNEDDDDDDDMEDGDEDDEDGNDDDEDDGPEIHEMDSSDGGGPADPAARPATGPNGNGGEHGHAHHATAVSRVLTSKAGKSESQRGGGEHTAPPGRPKGPRHWKSEDQITVLEDMFAHNPKPDHRLLRGIALASKLTTTQTARWFRNRRQRERLARAEGRTFSPSRVASTHQRSLITATILAKDGRLGVGANANAAATAAVNAVLSKPVVVSTATAAIVAASTMPVQRRVSPPTAAAPSLQFYPPLPPPPPPKTSSDRTEPAAYGVADQRLHASDLQKRVDGAWSDLERRFMVKDAGLSASGGVHIKTEDNGTTVQPDLLYGLQRLLEDHPQYIPALALRLGLAPAPTPLPHSSYHVGGPAPYSRAPPAALSAPASLRAHPPGPGAGAIMMMMPDGSLQPMQFVSGVQQAASSSASATQGAVVPSWQYGAPPMAMQPPSMSMNTTLRTYADGFGAYRQNF